MADASDFLGFNEAAEEKDCGRTTVYRAANDGRINTVEIGGRRVIVRDEAFEKFEPQPTGRRVSNSDDED